MALLRRYCLSPRWLPRTFRRVAQRWSTRWIRFEASNPLTAESMSDFIQAVRGLRRSPALVAVAILSLTLGIGANVTVFSVVREMILDNLSARRPERLARVEGVDVSYTLYWDLRLAEIGRASCRGRV